MCNPLLLSIGRSVNTTGDVVATPLIGFYHMTKARGLTTLYCIRPSIAADWRESLMLPLKKLPCREKVMRLGLGVSL